MRSAMVGPAGGPYHWQVEPSSLQNLPNVQEGTIFAPRKATIVSGSVTANGSPIIVLSGPQIPENGITAVLDGWGHAIVWRPTATFHPLTGLYTYSLPGVFISAGPNGVMGSADNISVEVR